MEEKEKIKGVGIESIEDIRAEDMVEFIIDLTKKTDTIEDLRKLLHRMLWNFKDRKFECIKYLMKPLPEDMEEYTEE